MNGLWVRALRAGLLKSMFEVLERELHDMEATKQQEIAEFDRRAEDPDRLCEYQKNSGLTKDACARILNEIQADLTSLAKLKEDGWWQTDNAVDGESSLKTLYCEQQKPSVLWTGKYGQQPVDLIVVRPNDSSVPLGDCKFGLAREDPWIVRNVDQFNREFKNKIDSVSACLIQNDGVAVHSEMLMIVRSHLAPLLKNRMADFKEDPRYRSIPYDDILVCSVSDIYLTCTKIIKLDE